jgi:hypothetical protein
VQTRTPVRYVTELGPPSGISTPTPDFQKAAKASGLGYDLGARCEALGHLGPVQAA